MALEQAHRCVYQRPAGASRGGRHQLQGASRQGGARPARCREPNRRRALGDPADGFRDQGFLELAQRADSRPRVRTLLVEAWGGGLVGMGNQPPELL